jgi:GPH family glycoside/pentoside/hexuronide:cation symporter/probable glucitol transport protein GutA
MLLFFLALSGKMSLSVYYYIYILERPDLVGPIMMSFSIACMVTVFVFKGFSEKIGKLKLLIISCAGSAVCSLMIFFIPNPANNIVLYFVLNTLAGVFISIGAPLHYALVPDAIDYMEDKTGVRADGTSYTAISLSTKIAGAVGTSTGLLIMAVFGYVANVKQTPSGIMGINIGVNLFPMICFGLSIIPVLLYPLTSEKNREIRERLIQKSSIKISQQMEGV